MRKDNRKVLSPSDLIRGSRLNNKAIMFDVDSRVKPENDVIKRLPENDSGGNENGCGWKRRGGAAVAVMSVCLVVCMGASEALAQCAVPPSCESLGYDKTVTDCGNRPIIKCPFDTAKVYCGVYVDPEGKPIAEVGDIMYSDKTFTSKDNIIKSKVPIAVVFDPDMRLAVSIVGIDVDVGTSGAAWAKGNIIGTTSSRCNNLDIPDLVNYSSCESDFDGRNNTKKIVNFKKSDEKYANCQFPAAEYCFTLTTPGTIAGDWYLPAGGELYRLMNVKSKIASSLYAVAGLKIKENSDNYPRLYGYWTSTEVNSYSACGISYHNSPSTNESSKSSDSNGVLCIIKY